MHASASWLQRVSVGTQTGILKGIAEFLLVDSMPAHAVRPVRYSSWRTLHGTVHHDVCVPRAHIGTHCAIHNVANRRAHSGTSPAPVRQWRSEGNALVQR
jgi:hypothetical protein